MAGINRVMKGKWEDGVSSRAIEEGWEIQIEVLDEGEKTVSSLYHFTKVFTGKSYSRKYKKGHYLYCFGKIPIKEMGIKKRKLKKGIVCSVWWEKINLTYLCPTEIGTA